MRQLGEQTWREEVATAGFWASNWTVSRDRFWVRSDASHCMAHRMAEVFKQRGLQRVADFGCGAGDWVASIRARGVQAEGYDGNPDVEQLTGGLCKQADFALKRTYPAYDAVFSFEVAEHIPKEFEGVFLDNLLQSRPRLALISWSPGGKGHGHVNPQQMPYVTKVFFERGYLLDLPLTWNLRNSTPRSPAWDTFCKPKRTYVEACGCCCSWVADNLLAFARWL